MIWATLPFPDVFADKTSGNVKTLQSDYLKSGQFPIVDQGQQLIGGYTNDGASLCNVDGPVIVFGDHTKAFKYVDFPFCIGADGTKILKPKIDADMRYLFHAARQIHIPDNGYSRHFKYLKKGEIPLPPLEEQRRIAGILDQADALRRHRTRALDKLNTLGQAIFHEMFGDVQTNPRGLPTRTLSQVATFTSGATPSKKNSSFWENGDIPWITPKDMKSYELHGSIDHVTQSATEQTNLKTIQVGTPLIVVRGMILAHTVPMGITRTACTINQDMKAINFADCVLPEFGLACLLAQHASLLSRVDTAAHGTKRFDLDRLGETIVLVPPHEDQQRFLDALHVARQVAKNSTFAGTIDQGLFASLQHRAFRGEL